ncbi:Por secretion system C-terminal sorting domain-containing protein [Lutibacter agarilyticus]|uniref:Por secretion system C-terminal sorting domain-containing protein n=2 Tax=Lutibacter agarilyticus TaxID=1109740 RepID=A0A238W5B5_9FLAO|nr:Por secretion system C-terminal sorting domain-containing protein [Lutibacter agarilyticus]
MDMTSNQVDILHNINGTTDGRIFEGSFTVYNNKLYAVSFSGGQNNNGTLVSFDPSNNTLTTLKHLTIENGKAFKSSPAFWDDSTLSVDNFTNQGINFKIYPNPTNASFIVNFEDYDKVMLYDYTGRKIKTYSKSTSYNTQNLKVGLYYVSLLKQGKIIGRQKIIISK